MQSSSSSVRGFGSIVNEELLTGLKFGVVFLFRIDHATQSSGFPSLLLDPCLELLRFLGETGSVVFEIVEAFLPLV